MKRSPRTPAATSWLRHPWIGVAGLWPCWLPLTRDVPSSQRKPRSTPKRSQKSPSPKEKSR